MNLRKDFNFWEKMKKKNEKKLLRIHFFIFPPELRKPSPPSPPGRVRGVLLKDIYSSIYLSADAGGIIGRIGAAVTGPSPGS